MAEAPENKKQNDGEAVKPASSTPVNAQRASLSEKAEKLAARLEEHKNQQPKPTEQPASAKAAPAGATAAADPAKAASPPPASGAQASATQAAPKVTAAKKPAAVKPAAAKSAPAVKPTTAPKTAVQPAAAKKPAAASAPVNEPLEDIIRAIKLPHEIDAETQQSAKQNKPAPARTPLTSTQSGQPAVPPVSVAGPSASEKSEASAAAVAAARSRVFGSHASNDAEPSEAAVKRRVARERALSSKPPLARTAQVLLAIIFPILTLIAAIRLVATPGFLALAYGRPGFPVDDFGFSWPERLTFASYGVDYLNNFAGPEYLSGLRQGDGSALFVDSEVAHMIDVKNLIGFAYILGAVLGVVAIVLLVYLARRYAGGVRRALFSGALVTLGLIAALIVTAVLGWQSFFTAFHKLFFADGSWTFSVSDTLIRLYPEQFWMDSAITIGALVLLAVIIVLISCWPTGRRREASRLRQEARVFGLGNS